MKILIYSDVHWCSYSSIVRQRGEKYSKRLENLIKSMQWIQQLEWDYNNIGLIINTGDFFDKSNLNSEEITALKEVNLFVKENHISIVGNHEMGTNDLIFNSTNALRDYGDNIASFPYMSTSKNIDILFLPYILENNRQTLKQILSELNYVKDPNKKLIVFSHNDIKGVQMGMFKSETGFDIKDIQDNCDLFINGHIHNGGKVADKIYNVGNLSGQNFNEDGFKYKHGVYILDTDTLELEFIENPYAFRFFKFNYGEHKEFKFEPERDILSITCKQEELEDVKKEYEGFIKRIIVDRGIDKDAELDKSSLLKVDHLERFKDYVLTYIGADKVTEEELTKICC